jgi:glycosyltransferase involved in cell wall biosynthesis
MVNNNKLAIIIPAYKSRFLEKALISIDNQTNKSFTLYIGDDASAGNLKSIVDRFEARINLKYYRFNENLGTRSLTKQWERCINLSTEEYVWLFSDDDEMPSDAVERLYKVLNANKTFDVYRFNIQFIDESGCIIREASSHPRVESSKEFVQRRLTFSTLSAGCEYIFRRERYLNSGGFVEFPLGWCSDDATWALFGKLWGIYTIDGSPIRMRMVKGFNISSIQSNKNSKFKAVITYLFWLNDKEKFGIERSFFIKYLISQIRELSVNIVTRMKFTLPILRLVGLLPMVALIINKAKIYRMLLKDV